MSVLLEGLNIPEGNPITINIYKDGTWVNAYTTEDGKAVNIPPHGDLVSREWLIDIALHLMNIAKNDDIANGVKWLWQYVIEAPTIIEAEEGK